MESGNENVRNKRKWKKKKSLLTTAKKYAKKEQWGRGADIPEDMYHYLVGILEVMKNGFSEDEERDTFVNNVLEKTLDNEIMLSTNQLGCRIIEELLRYSKPEDLERYMKLFSDDLRTICTDKYSSFVLETIIEVCSIRANSLQNETNDDPPEKKRKVDEQCSSHLFTEEHVEKCFAFIIKIAKYLLNNLEDFVWDYSANRVLRTSLKYLGGIISCPCDKPKQPLIKNLGNKEEVSNKIKDKSLVYKDVPKEFQEIVEEHANRLSRWPQFTDMPYDTITSGLLQILVFALDNVNKKLSKTLVRKLLDESLAPDSWLTNTDDDKKDCLKIDSDDILKSDQDNNDCVLPQSLPPVFDSEPAVRLLEAILHIARSKTYTKIYAKCFINRLLVLSRMPGLNFTVQRLFDNCTMKEEFESMFDEISDNFDKILINGNTGVLAAVSKACLRLQSKQVKFVHAMEKALGCSDSENQHFFAVACARLIPLSRIDTNQLDKPYFVNINGSVILQTILSFQRPKRLIDSLLKMNQKELLILFCDAKGCHIIDSYFKGPFVGSKSKDLLIKKLKGSYQELAISKYGSRAFEIIFKGSNIEQKSQIMEEMSNKSQLLNSTMFGQLIFSKLKIDLYKKSFQRWKSSLEKEEKTKILFEDIVCKKIKK